MNPIVESWQIHNRINLYLVDALDESALSGQAGSKGRTVGEQFAHIHNVRLMWLKAADPKLLDGLGKLETEAISKAGLRAALEASGAAIGALLENALATDQRIKNFKPHATAFFGYLVSHESHHRGQLAVTLKQSGHPLDKKTSFGLWEWGIR